MASKYTPSVDGQIIRDVYIPYALRLFYLKNKIYFKENTNQIIDDILKGFQSAFWDYNEFNFYKEAGVTDRDQLVKSRQKMIDSYKSVKDEFRKLLSVE